MHCVATLHPDLVDARSENYIGGFFTEKEKKKQIIDFHKNKSKKGIPLCIDHCNANKCGFVVPEKERIGNVTGLFNGKEGQMFVKFKLDNKHEAYSLINKGIFL